MKLANTEKDKQLYGDCGILPGWNELKSLKVGNYLRLRTEGGAFFWALVLQRKGNRFVCRLDDAVPELERGALCSCGCDDIFGVV